MTAKPGTGYCLNCDNRHGCKSRTPPCIDVMMKHKVKKMSGKQYLIETNETDRCKDCPFLRTCWKASEYARFVK